MVRTTLVVGCLALTVSLCGCGNGAPKLVPVSGKVTYKNKPLVPGSVWLTPDGGDTTLKSSGLLQLDGSFTARTHPHGDGVPPGTYKVSFTLGGGTTPELTPYSQAETTPLRVTIPPEGLPNWVIELPIKSPTP